MASDLPPPEGPGFLVACNFGSEERAAVEVQKAVHAIIATQRAEAASAITNVEGTGKKRSHDDVDGNDNDGGGDGAPPQALGDAPDATSGLPPHYLLLPRGAVAHMGLAWLRCPANVASDKSVAAAAATQTTADTDTTPGASATTTPPMDPIALFATLMGKPTPTTTTPMPEQAAAGAEAAAKVDDAPRPTVLKACQQLFPISRCCAATEEALQAAVLAEATAMISLAEGSDSPLAAASTRVAVAVHTRGDDSQAAKANGAATLTRAAALNATLKGLAAAREAAGLPPLVADLHSPDVVVVVSQWRQVTAPSPADEDDEDGPGTGSGGDAGTKVPAAAPALNDLNGANRPICGISILPRALCDVRSKVGLYKLKSVDP
jgi:hypothetical protein